MLVGQNYVPGWNAIYSMLLNKIAKTIITNNVYKSPFSQMVQNMEVGTYLEDIHLNPTTVLLQKTVTNSDILSSYVDDIAVVSYENTVDLVYPSTYTEYVVRQGFTLLQNVSSLINALVANIRVSLEYHRTNLVKQMLFNAYQYGQLSSVTIGDPLLSRENSAKFVVAMNTVIDDFKTEMNTRNVMYNNMVGLTDAEKRITIENEQPYIILFNNFLRDTEMLNALNLGLVGKFSSGNGNQDFAERLIFLNKDDFPATIPAVSRDQVTGNNVSAKDINFFPMPVDKAGQPLFPGTPTGGDTILGFVLSPKAIKIETQLNIMTSWLNPATLQHTNREIYLAIMALSAFNKICVITCNEGV